MIIIRVLAASVANVLLKFLLCSCSQTKKIFPKKIIELQKHIIIFINNFFTVIYFQIFQFLQNYHNLSVNICCLCLEQFLNLVVKKTILWWSWRYFTQFLKPSSISGLLFVNCGLFFSSVTLFRVANSGKSKLKIKKGLR